MERKSELQTLFSQRTVLNQSSRFSLKLLEMNRQELQRFIDDALIENPFLEIKDNIYGENLNDLVNDELCISYNSSDLSDIYHNPDTQCSEVNEISYCSASNSSDYHIGSLFSAQRLCLNENDYENIDGVLANVAAPLNIKEEFFKQLAFLKFTNEERIIAEQLFDYLLENQYLHGEFLRNLSKERGISYENLLNIIRKLQKIPPYGMFSFNFQDRLKSIWEASGKYDDQHRVFVQNISFLFEKNIEYFKQRTKLNAEDFARIMEDVRKICGYSYSITNFAEDSSWNNCAVDFPSDFVSSPSAIISAISSETAADLRIKRCRDSCEVESCNTVLPIVRRDLFDDFWNRTKSKSDREYMREKINNAEFLVRAINLRDSTLVRICKEIVRRQIDFFMGDSSFLLPIDTKSIATAMMCHPSTVHRAISNKLVDTPCGTFLLKDLMPREISTNQSDQVATTKSIQEYIKKMIQGEPKNSPYSDEELTYFLKQRGINISRRTVSKYRKHLAIANSNERLKEEKWEYGKSITAKK